MALRTETLPDARAFLARTRPELEANEAANSLLLGLCAQLVRHPGWISSTPCLKTIGDERGLVLAALMTPPHNLIVYGRNEALLGGARCLVEGLLDEGWAVPGVTGQSQAATAVAQAWTAATGTRHDQVRRQYVYELRDVRIAPPARGRLRLASRRDLVLVSRWRHEFLVGIFGTASREESDRVTGLRVEARDVYLWDDEGPVSMAMKTRPTRRGITLSYVYTPPDSRRRGYATACVAELSRVLLAAGWEFCTLFADVANSTANHIYQRIGYRPVCEYHEYAFAAER